MANVDDCELFDHGEDPREVAARRPHQCCECLGTIERGERHMVVRAVTRGEGWSTWRFCLGCWAARLKAEEDLKAWECIPYGYLMDELDARDLARNEGDENDYREVWTAHRLAQIRGRAA